MLLQLLQPYPRLFASQPSLLHARRALETLEDWNLQRHSEDSAGRAVLAARTEEVWSPIFLCDQSGGDLRAHARMSDSLALDKHLVQGQG